VALNLEHLTMRAANVDSEMGRRRSVATATTEPCLSEAQPTPKDPPQNQSLRKSLQGARYTALQLRALLGSMLDAMQPLLRLVEIMR
jgi:hypothetical protein